MEQNPEDFSDAQYIAAYENLGESIAKVGGHMRLALGQTARQIGGEPFAKEVVRRAGDDPLLPDVEALKLIEKYDPHGKELFWSYTREAQRAAHKQDWINLGKASLQRIVRFDRFFHS